MNIRSIFGFLLCAVCFWNVYFVPSISEAYAVKSFKNDTIEVTNNKKTPINRKDFIKIANTSIIQDRYGTTAYGEVTNTSDKIYDVYVLATFYDKDKKIIGTSDDYVRELFPEVTETFEAHTSKTFNNYNSYKVQISSIFERTQ